MRRKRNVFKQFWGIQKSWALSVIEESEKRKANGQVLTPEEEIQYRTAKDLLERYPLTKKQITAIKRRASKERKRLLKDLLGTAG